MLGTKFEHVNLVLKPWIFAIKMYYVMHERLNKDGVAFRTTTLAKKSLNQRQIAKKSFCRQRKYAILDTLSNNFLYLLAL